jgi:protein-S-isoprenylcysteine O-methyltransferase Ste14
MTDTSHDHASVIAPPPLIVLAGLVVGLVLDALIPTPIFDSPLNTIIGLVLIVLSVMLGWAALIAMRQANTSPDPYHPVSALVTNGPFRFTRNPIYLSFVLLFIGVALLANSWLMLVVLVILILIMQNGVIEREERYLESKFGDEYRQYRSSVRRWI